ncbi:MAG: cation-translocating P-type ATPase [Clostridia bacterium]|nr:cation-translocating P-type ATPase [Clostridia bacterium]
MWYEQSTEEVARKLKTNTRIGLAESEVEKRKIEFGKNKLDEQKKESIFIKFIKQFNDFMIIILIIASIVSTLVSKMQGENDYFDSIIIIAIVILNAIMGLVQEERAEKSIESLKKMTPEMAKVIRDGKTEEVIAEELVPGDIIELEDGKYVPADCRIIESYNLKIEESSLTGETEPVTKTDNILHEKNITLADLKNMAFMTTIVTHGHGKAIVTETGMDTKIGQIANMIIKEEAPETPIQKKLSEVGKILGLVCLGICAIIFIIGILKKIEPIEMFMTSVGLAVAAIPEGLPAIVTIMLSIGVTKMARKNSIIRRLPAVETLGSSSVICSDKTGTLTQNKMTVVKTFSDNEKFLLELGSMCTDCLIQEENGIPIATGEATELAIVNKALDENINKVDLYRKMPRVDEIPFDSSVKMMTTIHKLENNSGSNSFFYKSDFFERDNNLNFSNNPDTMNNYNNNHQQMINDNNYINGQQAIQINEESSTSTYRIITKGAPDVLIEKCSRILVNGKIQTITNMQRNKIKQENFNMANNALRVLAVAYKDEKKISKTVDFSLKESNTNQERADKEPVPVNTDLIFVGLIGMIDPPREGVKEAVQTCKKAGIKTVMITGDHIATAKAIAKEIGILNVGDEAITGKELDKISNISLEKNINKYSVFARVTPEHKVRIVKAWQKTGAVVAMTGDGVNDSPALKNADIGIAMGKSGTDVAKNAADMILVDDNFVTIVEAVRQGRNIYDNIKKAIHFLIATNIGEIVTIFIGLLLGLETPLLAIQLLWINLVTDSFPAIALGLEKEENGIMERKPRNSKESIFAGGLWYKIITEGIMLGSLTLFAFALGNKYYGVQVGRTMAFVSLGLLELVHSFNIKTDESIFKTGIFENKYLIGSFFAGTFLQIVVVVVPYLARIFELVSLNKIQWIYTIAISLLPIIIIELQKMINKIRFKNPSYCIGKIA